MNDPELSWKHEKNNASKYACFWNPGTYNFNIYSNMWGISWIGKVNRTIWHQNGVCRTLRSIFNLVKACSKVPSKIKKFQTYKKCLIWSQLAYLGYFCSRNGPIFATQSKIMSQNTILHVFRQPINCQFLVKFNIYAFIGIELIRTN